MRPSITALLISILAPCGLTLPAAYGQFTATYSFPLSATDVPIIPNVTFGAVTNNGTGGISRLSGGSISNSGWSTGDVINTGLFNSFTLEPTAGYALDLSSMSLRMSRSSTGPSSIAIGLFVDGVSQQTSSVSTITSQSVTTSSFDTLTFDFNDLTNIVGTAELRIYGWDAGGSVGTLRLDNITLTGSVSVSAVPEPSTYATMAGAASLAGAMWWRRRQTKPHRSARAS